MSEQNPYVSDQEEFAKAGLWDEGAYKFRFESMTAAERTVQNDNPKMGSVAGDTYNVINARLVAVEQALYDEEGEFEGTEDLDPEKSRFQDFPIAGRGLAMFKSAYKAVTGRMPSGVFNEETGRFDIDLLGLAEELLGSTAWNRVYYGKPNEETKVVYDKISFNFTKNPPKTMYAKKKEKEAGEQGVVA